MRRFYEEHEVLFAVLMIVAYCLVLTPLKANYGYASTWMLLALMLMAVALLAFVRALGFEEKYGLVGWPPDMRRFLYFIPMWVIATGNLWDGIAPELEGMELTIAILAMMLVGLVEELIFRGFLFEALLAADGPRVAVVVSSITFGLGHIVNLLAGQATLETAVQVVFAVSWGFVLTMSYHKGASLIPCILAHALVDVSAQLGANTFGGDVVYITSTIVVAIAFSLYLARLETPARHRGGRGMEASGSVSR